MSPEVSTTATSDYLLEVFGPGGLFARKVPGYEPRPGQLALTRLVDLAMQRGVHALGEAPCGSGKSLAYGVPAVHHAVHRDERVVIVTANIALQEQLVQKDLPLLQRVLPWPFSFELLKGRGNYLCVDRFEESERRGELLPRDEGERDEQLEALLRWRGTTERGDVSELPFVPRPHLWSRVSVSSDDCKGQDCKHAASCFANRAHVRARGAHILVTNYHLLFAHLAVRQATGEDLVLPPFDRLVLDEAHEAAHIAREFFGFTVSERGVKSLGGAADGLGARALGDALRDETQRFFAGVAAYARSGAYAVRLREPGWADPSKLVALLRQLAERAHARAHHEDLPKDKRAAATVVQRRAATAAGHLREVAALEDARCAYWIEAGPGEGTRLRASQIEVGSLLHRELFGRTPTVLVSATLTAGGDFGFVRRELGVPAAALELAVPSPFDFSRQALLVVPEGLPEPAAPDFIECAAAAFRRVIAICRGRTLGLFTSHRNLDAVHVRIATCGYRLLKQGERPRAELARVFRDDVSSVLLGTDSFWTGLDVPGQALTALVIDKLPFPNPKDPIIDAITERTPDAFMRYLLPLAILKLRQGVGRLIRSRSDVGVAVVLDRRLVENPYGRAFVRSLPAGMRLTRDLGLIGRFLERLGARPVFAATPAA